MSKLSIAIALAFALPAMATEVKAYRLGAQEQISLDGKLDDAVWQHAERDDTFYEFSPRDKRPAGQPTSLQIAYDDKYLYVGMSATDSNPDLIREPFARRDKVYGEQDFFAFLLDTAGDNKSAQFFRINPRGVLADGMMTGGNEDFAPDFDFDGAASRTATGWSAELRIPFSSLAFNAGTKDWHVFMLRSLTRTDRFRFTSGQPPRDTDCLLCYSSSLTGFTPPQPGLNWTITPQVVVSQADETRPDGRKVNKRKTDVSLDAKVRPSSDLVVDLTLNPDFSQVELDSPALTGNSHFALFFPEKRPFFLEGSDLLKSPLQAIYTRTITDPMWGARATWRGEDGDATMLTTRDNGGGVVVLPGTFGNDYAPQNFKSQATIARATQRQGGWQFGEMLTDRTLEGGRGYNRVLGGDVNWQIDSSNRARAQVLWSETTALPDKQGELQHGAAQSGYAIQIDRSRQTSDWNFFGMYRAVSPKFRSDNGFITQNGVREVYAEATRKFAFDGAWHEVNGYVNADRTIDADGRTLFQNVYPGLFLGGPYDSGLNIEWRANEQSRIAKQGPLLSRQYVHLYAEVAPTKWISRMSASVDLGDQIDYESHQVVKGGYLSLWMHLRPLPRLEVEQNIDRFWLQADAKHAGRAFTETAYQLNSTWHFTAKDNARLIWQRGSNERNQSAYDSPIFAGSTRKTTSLVYSHREGLGKALYVGTTLVRSTERGRPVHGSQNEVFVKGSWSL